MDFTCIASVKGSGHSMNLDSRGAWRHMYVYILVFPSPLLKKRASSYKSAKKQLKKKRQSL